MWAREFLLFTAFISLLSMTSVGAEPSGDGLAPESYGIPVVHSVSAISQEDPAGVLSGQVPVSTEVPSAGPTTANSVAVRPAVPAVSSWTSGLLIVYCTLIVAASVIGGWLPSIVRLTHTRMQTIISFVGGLMLGIGIFHLLPHAAHTLLSVDEAAKWMMVGIVSMFFLIRTFHFHHHGPLEVSPAAEDETLHLIHDHDHDHDHDHGTDCNSDPGRVAKLSEKRQRPAETGLSGPQCQHAHQLSWVGIAAGLSLHTLFDGIALASSVQAESAHPARLSLYGLGTFLAVMLHKPLDAVSITSLMAASGWKRRSRNLVNAGFAMMCPAGALIFFLGITRLQGLEAEFVGAALAFSAGIFVCISLSDLLPEMEFHAHNRSRLSAALAAGILLAWGITFLEPPHIH